MQLADKTVLITGAAKRIGRQVALTLAEQGANIVIHYRSSRRDAESVRRQVEAFGVNAYLVKADFSARGKGMTAGIKKFAAEVRKKAGPVDVLVNNASAFYPTPLSKVTERQWDDLLTANLKAPFFLSREIGLSMAKRKTGCIINLLDWTALRPYNDYLPYAISKAGLLAATRGMARALAPHVRVNGIAPGPILPAEGSSAAQRKKVLNKTLLRRFGHPKDIAETVKFLCQGTNYTTGACIPVEGGASIA